MHCQVLALLVVFATFFSTSNNAATFIFFEDLDPNGLGVSDTINSFTEVSPSGDNGISFEYYHVEDPNWPNSRKRYTVAIGAPKNSVLLPGLYIDASNFSSTENGSIFAERGVTCSGQSIGSFTVLEADFINNVFAIDFEFQCIGEYGLYADRVFKGNIRYNSDIPQAHSMLFANAGRDQYRTEGDTVILNSEADSGGNQVTNYQWNQTSGLSVSLSQATPLSNAEFILPRVSNVTEDLVFDLTVTDELGQTSSDSMVVRATNLDGPKNYIRFYNNQTLVKEYTLNDGQLYVPCMAQNLGATDCDRAHSIQFSFTGAGNATQMNFSLFNPRTGTHTAADGHGYCINGSIDPITIDVFSMVKSVSNPTALSTFAADITQDCHTTSRLDNGEPYTKIEYRLNTLYPNSDPSNPGSGSGSSAGAINLYMMLLLLYVINFSRNQMLKVRS